MVPIKRSEVNLYEEAKAGLGSLIQQIASVFIGFVVMLLVTGGAPSSFVVALSFCLGTALVAWSEQRRIIKSRVVSTINTLDEQPSQAASPQALTVSPQAESTVASTSIASQPARLHILLSRRSDLELQLQFINQAKSQLANIYEQLVLSDKVNHPSAQRLIQQVHLNQDLLENQLQRITAIRNAIVEEIYQVRKGIDDAASNKQQGLEDTEFRQEIETLLSQDNFNEIQHELNEIQRRALELCA